MRTFKLFQLFIFLSTLGCQYISFSIISIQEQPACQLQVCIRFGCNDGIRETKSCLVVCILGYGTQNCGLRDVWLVLRLLPVVLDWCFRRLIDCSEFMLIQ